MPHKSLHKKDSEIYALAVITEAITGLTEEATQRVFNYATERKKSDLAAGDGAPPVNVRKRGRPKRINASSTTAVSEPAAKFPISDQKVLAEMSSNVHDLDIPGHLKRNK